MAIYKFGTLAISAQATRGLAALAIALGVTASLGTFASSGTHSKGFISKSFNYSLHPVALKKTTWDFHETAHAGTFKRSDGLTVTVEYGTDTQQNKRLKTEWQSLIEPVRNVAGTVQEKVMGPGWQGLMVNGQRKNLHAVQGVDFYLEHGGHYSIWKCTAPGANQKLLKDCRASVQSLQFLDTASPTKSPK